MWSTGPHILLVGSKGASLRCIEVQRMGGKAEEDGGNFIIRASFYIQAARPVITGFHSEAIMFLRNQ